MRETLHQMFLIPPDWILGLLLRLTRRAGVAGVSSPGRPAWAVCWEACLGAPHLCSRYSLTFTLAQTPFYVFLAAHSIQSRAFVPALNRVLAAPVGSVAGSHWHAPTVFLTM